MRYLPIPPAKYQGILLAILILAVAYVMWVLMRLNDLFKGALARWGNKLLDWLIEKQSRRM